MISQRLICFALASALAAHVAQAAPTLSVYPLGLNGSNNMEWAVDVTRDTGFLPTSLAVELAFAVDDSDLLGVDVNTAVWDHENAGLNPFTNSVTDGLWLDLIGDRTFGAFGSVFITSIDPQRLFTIETAGGGETTLRYGTAASGNPQRGNIIADPNGLHRYSGSVTVPEPASIAIVACALALVGTCQVRNRRAA
jgi:hypothetical protein